jgi:hypothetical protein
MITFPFTSGVYVMSVQAIEKILSFHTQLQQATERYVEETKKHLPTELGESVDRLIHQGMTPTVVTKALDESTALMNGVIYFNNNAEGWEKGVLHWADFAETEPALRGLSYPTSSDGVARRKFLADLPVFSRTAQFYHEMEKLIDAVDA